MHFIAITWFFIWLSELSYNGRKTNVRGDLTIVRSDKTLNIESKSDFEHFPGTQ